MSGISRRTLLSTLAGSAVGMAGGLALGRAIPGGSDTDAPSAPKVSNAIKLENKQRGSSGWQIGADGTRVADDSKLQIKGYASATSVNLGESIDFHVTVAPKQEFTTAIYRLGYYKGVGARHMVSSPALQGSKRAAPGVDVTTGTVHCDWPVSWTLDVPKDWTSGYYLAVFTTKSGWRNFSPFVVRDDARAASLCVIVPFTTYQAYNQWPLDGMRGKSLYYGYAKDQTNAPVGGKLDYLQRAYKVSFDRPYSLNGLPNHVDLDHDFLQWAEGRGYDLTYATSVDLHAGRVDLTRHAGVVFSGHDEYWSREMRDAAANAVDQGTSLAFLTANNVYWHVRLAPAADGRADRVVVCYKSEVDPEPGTYGGTAQWRQPYPAPEEPEQLLVGVQFNGIVTDYVPLVVQSADHWFWKGTGLKNGDLIDRMVGGEADGFFGDLPSPDGVTQTLLSVSPYTLADGTDLVQNTSLYEAPNGAIVFAASSLTWPYGLNHEGFKDKRIQTATANLLNRMSKRG